MKIVAALVTLGLAASASAQDFLPSLSFPPLPTLSFPPIPSFPLPPPPYVPTTLVARAAPNFPPLPTLSFPPLPTLSFPPIPSFPIPPPPPYVPTTLEARAAPIIVTVKTTITVGPNGEAIKSMPNYSLSQLKPSAK